MMTEEQLQDLHCDPSRGTDKGPRILRNVGDCAPWFPLNEKVLCVGCGDGLELQAWELLGYGVIGLEISKAKTVVAKAHGCRVWRGEANRLVEVSVGIQRYANIYCAHTLEHLKDAEKLLRAFGRIAVSTVAIIVPIEKNGTRNPSHHYVVKKISDIRINGWEVVRMEERYNCEPEGLVILRRT